MSINFKDIHEALLNNVLPEKSEYILEKAAAIDEDPQKYIESILNEIQPKVDGMKIGGHHSEDFEQSLFSQINDYNSFNHVIEKGHSASLFIDLTDFTTRTFMEDSEGIAKLKRTAIQIWLLFSLYNDGHVHSITGDGLMVLFNKEEEYIENSFRAYATAYNLLVSMDLINDRLELEGRDRLRVKVGLDYCKDVIWNVYGLLSSDNKCKGEVKATGFGIDFSAKLMAYTPSILRKNSNIQHNELIVFGEDIKEILSLDEKYLEEYKSDVNDRPTAPYKRRKGKEDREYKIYYSDIKKVSKQIDNTFIKYTDIALLVKGVEKQPIVDYPSSGDTMYA